MSPRRFTGYAGISLLRVDRSRPQAVAAENPDMLVWWGSSIECVSALSRLEREGALGVQGIGLALKRLRQFAEDWNEVDPSDAIREAAGRLLRVHPLRAADALQLAAAFLAAERRPPALEIVTLDDRLAVAAQKEGFKMTAVAPTE